MGRRTRANHRGAPLSAKARGAKAAVADRGADDKAIEALCFLLDRTMPGEPSALGSRSGLEATRGELWSTILRRRIRNKQYPPQRSDRVTWLCRHYYVRHLSHDHDESAARSAQHVAAVWSTNWRTLFAAAKRRDAKQRALDWIEQCLVADKNHRI